MKSIIANIGLVLVLGGLTGCSASFVPGTGFAPEPDLSKADIGVMVPTQDEISQSTGIAWTASQPEHEQGLSPGASSSPAPSPGSPPYCWYGQTLIQAVGLNDSEAVSATSESATLKFTLRRYSSQENAQQNVDFISGWKEKCASNFESLGMQTFEAFRIDIPNAAKYKLTTLGVDVSHVVFRVGVVVATVDISPVKSSLDAASPPPDAGDLVEKVAMMAHDKIVRQG
jgi:hypothetical protein